MITVLCGGVGAARLLQGLVKVVDPEEITAIVNTGDDLELHGLSISPDIDTIIYTLSGAGSPAGWGLADESFATLSALERFGESTWFALGDKDLATHIYRTMRLSDGATLTEVTRELTRAWRLALELLPMTDDPVRTRIELVEGGEVSFQEYFVKLAHDVAVSAVSFVGSASAQPAPGVVDAIQSSEAVVVAPSNPIVSIGPILSVKGIGEALSARRQSVVAISPIVGGKALKGPADRLLVELGGESSVLGVAERLSPIAGTLVIDDLDAALAKDIGAQAMDCVVTNTVMSNVDAAAELCRVALIAAKRGGKGT